MKIQNHHQFSELDHPRRPHPNQFGRNGRLRTERSDCRGSPRQSEHDRQLGNFRCPQLGKIECPLTVLQEAKLVVRSKARGKHRKKRERKPRRG